MKSQKHTTINTKQLHGHQIYFNKYYLDATILYFNMAHLLHILFRKNRQKTH